MYGGLTFKYSLRSLSTCLQRSPLLKVTKLNKFLPRPKQQGRTSLEHVCCISTMRQYSYEEAFHKSLHNRDSFWSEVAEGIDWYKPYTKVIDHSNPPFTKW